MPIYNLYGYYRRLKRLIEFLAAFAFLVCLAAPIAAQVVAVFHTDATARSEFAELFSNAGYQVIEIDEDRASRIDKLRAELFVIAPDTRFPAAARPPLYRYLQNGGNLMALSPIAFDYTSHPTKPVELVDLSRPDKLKIRQPTGGQAEVVDLPHERRALMLKTARVGAGVFELIISLQTHRRIDHSLICFEAIGDHDLEILRLRLVDSDGRHWVAFAKLDREWREYRVSMADFLLVRHGEIVNDKAETNLASEASKSPEQVDPAKVTQLSIGIDPAILWSEQPGSIGLAKIELAVPDQHREIATSARLPWRLTAQRAKADFSDWIFDPFFGSNRLSQAMDIYVSEAAYFLKNFKIPDAAGIYSIPKPPAVIGQTTADLQDTVPRLATRCVPLLTAKNPGTDETINVAELHMPDDYRSERTAVVAAFGLPFELYRKEPRLQELLVSTARYITNSPRILSVHPNTNAPSEIPKASADSDEPVQLKCRVVVFNPRPQEMLAHVKVHLAGCLSWSGLVELAPNKCTDVTANLGEVPVDFPFARFEWSVELSAANGEQSWDVLADTVDPERIMLHATCLMVENQHRHADGRISHHFFADVYGARALLQAARRFSEASISERHAELLEKCRPQDMRTASYRFCDMIVDRQQADGAIPIGYNDGKGWYYVADGGTIALGLVQLASCIQNTDPSRAERYLDAVEKFMEFRQTFRQDEDAAEKLRFQYGSSAPGIRVGDYGLGLLGVDIITGEKWGEVRRVMRGWPFVLGCSMPTAAALAEQTGEARWSNIAAMDMRHFLDAKYSMRGYFQSEAACWMFLAIQDDEIRREIRHRLMRDAIPAAVTGREHDMMEVNGRGALRCLSLLYCRHWFGDSPTIRAGLVKLLWETGSESSSYSIKRVGERFPGSGNRLAIAGSRYAAFAAIVVSELLNPRSTLLQKHSNRLP